MHMGAARVLVCALTRACARRTTTWWSAITTVRTSSLRRAPEATLLCDQLRGAGNTMIVEIPDPACVTSGYAAWHERYTVPQTSLRNPALLGRPFVAAAGAVRAAFDSAYPSVPISAFRSVNVSVRVRQRAGATHRSIAVSAGLDCVILPPPRLRAGEGRGLLRLHSRPDGCGAQRH
jgi:hypothetical protein